MKSPIRKITLSAPKSALRAAIATAAALGMVVIVPISASAEEQTIAGYTETTFMSAAMDQGIDPAVAAAAWGDIDAMAAIPVTSVSFPGVPEGKALDKSAPAITPTRASGSCYKYWNNVLGFEINRVTLNKQWSYSGSTISSPAAQFYGRAGSPYTFEGTVGSNDYYSTAYEDAHGTHTSYRQGKFGESLTGTSINRSVTLTSKLAGAYTCSYSA